MIIDTNDLANFVQSVEVSGSRTSQSVLHELLWLAYCRLCYTHSDRTTEMKAIRHEWAVLEAKLGVD